MHDEVADKTKIRLLKKGEIYDTIQNPRAGSKPLLYTAF